MRPRTTVAVITLALSLGCTSILNPAGARYAEAETLVETGEFDQAIKKYEEVAAGWPESPEAGMVPKAIEDALIAQIQTAVDARDYQAAEAAAARLEERNEERELGPALTAAVQFGGVQRAEITSLELLVTLDEHAGAGQVRDDIRAWTCERADKVLNECTRPITEDLDALGLDIFVMEKSCHTAPQVAEWCGTEVASTVTAAKERLAAARVAWTEHSAKQAELMRDEAAKLAAPCAGWAKQRDSLNVRMLNNMNRLGTLMQLSQQRDEVEGKLRKNRDEIEELRKSLKARAWPEDVRNATEKKLGEEAKRCT